MHAHLTFRAVRFALRGLASPLIRPWLAALVAGVATRLFMRHLAAAGAGLAILAGWAVLTMPGLLAWPPSALGRLPWAAVLLLAAVLLEPGWKIWPVRLGLAAVLAWWLRGTPVDAAGFAACVPVFFGLLAALSLAERMGEPAGGDPGWARAGAGFALAGALWAAGVSSHWVIAALVPAVAALVFVGLHQSRPSCWRERWSWSVQGRSWPRIAAGWRRSMPRRWRRSPSGCWRRA